MSDLATWLLGGMLSLPVYFEDRAPELEAVKRDQYAQVAEELAIVSRQAPRSPREWGALLITIAHYESGLSLRIHRGECKRHECDAGRARGPWQQQLNIYTRPVWDQLVGVENIQTQVRVASAFATRMYFTCRKSGADWVTGTLNAYAGRRCTAQWPGLNARLSTYRKLVGR